jgi:uncharacterized protein
MKQKGPVPTEDRYALPDILRGFAIAGIFVNNVIALSGLAYLPPEKMFVFPTGTTDRILMALQVIWVEGKFYSIFSMLFGIGFSIILARYVAKTTHPLRLFYRRLSVLALMGLLHALLLWEGDILLVYALVGMLLPLFRHWSNRSLLMLAICLLLMPVLVDLFRVLTDWSPGNACFERGQQLDRRNDLPLEPEQYAHFLYREGAGYLDIWKWNMSGFFYRWEYVLNSNRLFKVMGMFLIGLVAGRAGIVARPEDFRGLFRSVSIWGFALGIPFGILMLYFEVDSYAVPVSWLGLADTICYALSVVPLALAYAALIGLACTRPGRQSWLQLLAPAGRMALSLYIMQSVLGILVFYNLGLGVGLRFGYTWVLVIALTVYAAQVAFAHLWFRYFRYGPLEWIWRMLTYGSYLPILK